MGVNIFWTVTSMQKLRRTARGLCRRRLFLEHSDIAIARRSRCWHFRDFSAFFFLDIWPSKTGCLFDMCLMVEVLETVWEGVCLNQYILFQTSKETVFLIKRYQEIRTHSSWHTSESQFQSPHSKTCYINLCVCVKERHWKRDRRKMRKNERERVRPKRGRAKKRNSERESVGMHIIIPHVHVRVTIFATEGTVIIHCAAGIGHRLGSFCRAFGGAVGQPHKMHHEEPCKNNCPRKNPNSDSQVPPSLRWQQNLQPWSRSEEFGSPN